MKLSPTARRRLTAPLVYVAALFLLLEDWLWDLGAALMAYLARWPPLHRLEAWLQGLRPMAAMAVFVLPALLLFPVKLLALFAMARGHAVMGLAVIVTAKVAGAAAVARLYALTRPTLLTIAWFASLLAWFLALKQRWIARLQATAAWREMQALAAAVRRWRRRLPRKRWWPTRVLRRYAARWRARRRRFSDDHE
ncbi:hypothetical protein H3H36_09290 [Duganella sp. FT3S]|uniref:Transmembrane protein n=1 Tax=Rugamonas fusca TaxID=2758568 RepID=A0A7W2I6Q6_9BURK|nr:hypothetical protein [Rugamonas fusca]MBA5605553.1 hypothetical protein [Rugamonas fusca]